MCILLIGLYVKADSKILLKISQVDTSLRNKGKEKKNHTHVIANAYEFHILHVRPDILDEPENKDPRV